MCFALLKMERLLETFCIFFISFNFCTSGRHVFLFCIVCLASNLQCGFFIFINDMQCCFFLSYTHNNLLNYNKKKKLPANYSWKEMFYLCVDGKLTFLSKCSLYQTPSCMSVTARRSSLLTAFVRPFFYVVYLFSCYWSISLLHYCEQQ